MKKERAVLVVEDVDSKYEDVIALIYKVLPTDVQITRAKNLNEAEDLVMEDRWALLILDLSMDIAAFRSLDLGSGHATLAGLDVVERISLMKLNVSTLILTGFDSFQDPDRFDNAIMSVSDVDGIAAKLIGANYLGCIRYGVVDWEKCVQAALEKWSIN